MKITYKLTKYRALLSGIVLIFVSAITFCAALTQSPSTRIVAQYSVHDIRLSGMNARRWTTPDFSFEEPRIAAASTKIALSLEARRGSAAKDPAAFILESRHDRLAQSSITENTTLETPAGRITDLSGISLKGSVQNPLPSSVDPNLAFGVKLSAITLEPRFLLLLPTLSFGLIPIAALALLLIAATACTFNFKTHTISPLPAMVIAILSYSLLSENRLEFWDRAWWLWGVIAALCCGAMLWGYLHQKTPLETPIPSEKPPHHLSMYSAVLLLILFVGGLLVRVHSLDFGLPGYFHPDEGRKMKIARNMVATGDLNPHYFRHPTFLLYATAGMTKLATMVQGSIPPLPKVAYLGRSVSAILGSLSIVILFFIVRLLYSDRAGLMAAALLAVSPLHVVSSRYIKEDAVMVFFTLVSCYFAIKAMKSIRHSWLSFMLCSFFGGVAFSCKYSGLLTVCFAAGIAANLLLNLLIAAAPKTFSVLESIIFPLPNDMIREKNLAIMLVTAPILFTLGFLLVSPYALLDSEKFIIDFMGEKTHMERGHGVPITPLAHFWMYHVKVSVITAFRGVTAALAFIACGLLFARRKGADLLILCAILLFYLPSEYVHAKPPPQPERYILPCIPFLAAALGAALAWLSERLRALHYQRLSLVTSLIFLAALFPPLVYSVQHSRNIIDDTRLQARRWLIAHAPKHSKILIDWKFYSPPRLEKLYNISELKDKSFAKLARGISKEALNETGFDYFVLSSFTYGRFLDPLYRAHNLSERYKTLFAEMKPEVVFSNSYYAYGFHNPEIYIFKLSPGNEVR